MTVLPRPHGYQDQFYTDGEYAFKWDQTCLTVTKIGTGIKDQSIMFRNTSKPSQEENK